MDELRKEYLLKISDEGRTKSDDNELEFKLILITDLNGEEKK